MQEKRHLTREQIEQQQFFKQLVVNEQENATSLRFNVQGDATRSITLLKDQQGLLSTDS